ncbi:hypothetical protein B0H17DRAFT_1151808 [Mycena rosella]|uniref:Uncharacterized protein n=1 Tax=Mycena rosella TaxID=1033263 RepID=A0AAD7BHY0_MYCRO|nr:hypothetical protein B0H17DRAFT_1151808 [Mycena rosella]
MGSTSRIRGMCRRVESSEADADSGPHILRASRHLSGVKTQGPGDDIMTREPHFSRATWRHRRRSEPAFLWGCVNSDTLTLKLGYLLVGSISFSMLLEFRGTQFPALFIVANPSLFLELDWGHPARPRTFLETRSQPVPLQPAVSVKSEPSMASVRPGSPLRVKSEPDSGQRSFLQPRSLVRRRSVSHRSDQCAYILTFNCRKNPGLRVTAFMTGRIEP